MLVAIGIIIGLVMGLTGAGGALISIPLFIQFLAMDLKQATVYSLVTVIMGSIMNLAASWRDVDFKLAFTLTVFSLLGSIIAAPLKLFIASWLITGLLMSVSIYALWAIWQAPQIENKLSTAAFHYRGKILFLHLGVGLALGMLSTLTGLGGGVLMLPILSKVYRFPPHKAIATSIMTVGASSLFSLFIQSLNGAAFSLDLRFGMLSFGMILSVLLLKIILKKIPTAWMLHVSRVLFTGVVIFALLKIL